MVWYSMVIIARLWRNATGLITHDECFCRPLPARGAPGHLHQPCVWLLGKESEASVKRKSTGKGRCCHKTLIRAAVLTLPLFYFLMHMSFFCKVIAERMENFSSRFQLIVYCENYLFFRVATHMLEYDCVLSSRIHCSWVGKLKEEIGVFVSSCQVQEWNAAQQPLVITYPINKCKDFQVWVRVRVKDWASLIFRSLLTFSFMNEPCFKLGKVRYIAICMYASGAPKRKLGKSLQPNR